MKKYISRLIDDPEIRNWHIFTFLLLANVIIAWMMSNYVMTRDTYYVLLAERMDTFQIDNYLIMTRRYELWGYLLIPVILLIRTTCVAMLLQFCFMVRFKEIEFGKVFRVSLLGLGILSLGVLIKTLWLMGIPSEKITQKILATMPFSLSALLNMNNKNEALIGIYSSFNIFEIFWLITVIIGLKAAGGVKGGYSVIAAGSVWILIFFFQSGLSLYLARIFYG